VRSQASIPWERVFAPYPATDNVSALSRRFACSPPVHLDPLRCSLSMSSLPSATLAVSCSACEPLPLCPLGPASFLSLRTLEFCAVACALSSSSLPGLHHPPPPATAGRYTLAERRSRCVQHFLFNCKAPPPGSLDPADLYLDLLDILFCYAVAASWVRQALHVDSFHPAAVRRFCIQCLLDPFSHVSCSMH
jgi:hypothetical protein